MYTTEAPLVCKYNKKGKLKCRTRKPRKNRKNPKKSLELDEAITDSRSFQQKEQALKAVIRELADLLRVQGREVTGHYQYTESNTNGGNSFEGATNQPGGVTGHHQNIESNTNGGSLFERVTNQPGGQDVVTGHQATERNTNGGNGLELATQRPGGFTGYGHQSTEGNNEMVTTEAPLVCKYNKKGKLKCRTRKPRKNRKNPKKSLELDEAITDSRSFQQKEQALKAVIRELADLLRVQGREVTGHYQYTESNTNGGNSFEGATNQPGGVTEHHQNTESNTNGGSLIERVTHQPGGQDVVTGQQATERNTNGGNGLELATQ